MAGIGDSWGTREELLHPRGPDGRWIRKAGIAKGIIGRVLDFLANFRPRQFQSRGQASQYAHNLAGRAPRRMGRMDHARLLSDLSSTNEDLRDGKIDNPSTQRFVEMMDRSAVELPDDTILTRIVGTDAFGFTPETAVGTDSESNPGIRGMSGKLIADRGYGLTTIGGPSTGKPQGTVQMVVAAKKGTRVIPPGASPNDPTVFMDRDQPLRVTKVQPDGFGGWTMYVTAEERGGRDVPEPIGGPVGEAVPDTKEREARVRQVGRISATREKRPDEAAEQADIATRQARAEQLPPSTGQVEEQRRREAELQSQQPQQPQPPGTPPPRTEPVVTRSLGGEPRPEVGPGGAPQGQAPGAPEAPAAPRRAVDLRQAVRQAGIPSPAAGPNRKRFNDAYEGVISGKKDPIDAARDLDRDAADLEAAGDQDADNLRQLSDVIKREYGLEQPEAAPAKKAGKAAAPEAPSAPPPVPQPARKAAKKTAGGLTRDQEDRVIARAQEFRGNERNSEEERIVGLADDILTRRSGAPVKKAVPKAALPAKKVAPEALTPEQEIKGLFGGKRPTNAQLREMGERNNLGFGPKEPRSEMILAILGARPRRGRQRGEVPQVAPPAKKAPRVSTEDRVTDALLERMRPDVRERILADMPEEDRRAVDEAVARVRAAKKTAPEAPAPVKKAAKKAPAKKAAPETPGEDLDKMTKAELLVEAERRNVTMVKPSWTKDKIKAALRQREVVPEAPAPVKKAAKAAAPGPVERIGPQTVRVGDSILTGRDGSVTVARVKPDAPMRRVARIERAPTGRYQFFDENDKLIDSVNPNGKMNIRRGTKAPEAPAPAKKAAKKVTPTPPTKAPAPTKKAAKPAVPEAAPGTAAGKITAGRLQPGMRILVDANGNPTNRKTGSKIITIDSVGRTTGGRSSTGAPSRRSRVRIVGRDEDGNQVQVPGDASPSQTFIVAPEPGVAPAKKATKAAKKTAPRPDLEQAARDRQSKIDRARGYGNLGAEIEELIHNDASGEALAARIRSRGKQSGLDEDEIDLLARVAEGGNFNDVRFRVGSLLQREDVNLYERPGSLVPFDRTRHQSVSGESIPEGTMVEVFRPGRESRIDGEYVRLEKATVDPADPEDVARKERGERLVPEGSTTGDRTQAPVSTEPRKRSFTEAWDAAELGTEGSPGRSMKEIRDDVANGKITPEEGIRRMEEEIAFNKEDLAEIDANLRQPDLTDEERTKLQGNAAVLTNGIEAQEKASKFMRAYFRDEKPTVEEIKVRLGPEEFQVIQRATPETLREAAKGAGLDPPKGATKDEMLQDLVRQIAGQVARERGLIGGRPTKKAAKAVKKAAPAKKAAPSIPAQREKLDARTIGAGIEFDENDKWTRDRLDEAQKKLDEGKVTPAQIGRDLDNSVDAMRQHAAIQYGRWTDDIRAGEGPPDADELEYRARRNAELERLRTNADRIQELAERLKRTRRKPVKKAAAPEAQRVQAQLDDVQARLINERLEQVDKARTRQQADEALEGLTMPDLRRIAEQAGLKGRSKRELRDRILDHFKPGAPEPPPPPATPAPVPEAPAAPFRRIGARAKEAGIERPSSPFSGVNDAEGRANAMLQSGASGTEVARMLRERAAQVAKADLNDEGKRFRVEHDKDSLRAMRKSSAEYLRRLGTMLQQEEKGRRPAKRATPATPSAPQASTPQQILQTFEDTRRDPMSREDAHKLLGPLTSVQLKEMGEKLSVPGYKSMTKARLRDMIVEATVGRRLDSIAIRGFRGDRPGAPEPSVAPIKAAPGRPALKVVQGEGRGGGRAVQAPEGPRKFTVVPGAGGTVSGQRSTTQELRNDWGMLGTGGEVEFHDDGVIGQRLRNMGDDRLMDVDGEPLSNVVGKLATRAVRGQISQEQLLDELRRLEQRLPEGSGARRQVGNMIQEIDAPSRTVDLPEDTLPPFRTLMESLLRIPLARERVSRPGFRRDRDDSEVDKVLRLLEEFRQGRTGGLRFIGEIMDMRMSLPHESQEGRFEIDRALRRAYDELQAMYKEDRNSLYPKTRT